MKTWIAKKILKGIVLITLFGGIFGAAVMSLWNALMPELFQWPAISFWQAIGLLALTHILFHGFGRHCHGYGHGRHHWKQRFEEKLASLSPEEREKFKAEWQKRCGWKSEVDPAQKGEGK